MRRLGGEEAHINHSRIELPRPALQLLKGKNHAVNDKIRSRLHFLNVSTLLRLLAPQISCLLGLVASEVSEVVVKEIAQMHWSDTEGIFGLKVVQHVSKLLLKAMQFCHNCLEERELGFFPKMVGKYPPDVLLHRPQLTDQERNFFPIAIMQLFQREALLQ